MGLWDRIAGNTRCVPHRKILPCADCDAQTYRSMQMISEREHWLGPRGGLHSKPTGNKIDRRGIVWCGQCECRVIDKKCTNARCSTNRK